MLYHLLPQFAESFTPFNLFGYLTIRAGGALMTSFLISLWLGPKIILYLKAMQAGASSVRAFLEHHSAKQGTPSMGGVLMLVSLGISMGLWGNLAHAYTWILLGITFLFGGIGAIDDTLTFTKRRVGGIPGKFRLLIQAVLAVAAIWLVLKLGMNGNGSGATEIYIPFFKDLVVQLGLFGFLAFSAFVIVGSANAVNLTDGLDGLVSIPAAITAAALGLLAYIVGRVDYTAYLNIAYIAGAGEVAVFCGALMGSILGFLWFNAPPARVFMGDTGSLAIGGALGTAAVIIKQEVAFAIIAGLFVLETVSVIVQVASFKLTGRRVFKMAPLHHHFERLGWPETTIVVRFWILSLLLAMAGLATLKLR